MEHGSTHLETLVLQHLLDGDVTISWIVQQSRLEDDTKGTVSDDFAVGIGDLPLVAGLAIRGDDLDDLDEDSDDEELSDYGGDFSDEMYDEDNEDWDDPEYHGFNDFDDEDEDQGDGSDKTKKKKKLWFHGAKEDDAKSKDPAFNVAAAWKEYKPCVSFLLSNKRY